MLRLPDSDRDRLWRTLIETIESYGDSVGSLPVAPPADPSPVRELLAPIDFEQPMPPHAALAFAAHGLRLFQVHTPHPRYFGLFNPAPTTMGIAADALVAAFNPQMAAWSHNPFAAEVEQHLVRAFGGRFGYDPTTTEGTFCSGGAEANHTALLTALVHQSPAYASAGVRALERPPTLYVSIEGHHSILKAARLSGLGTEAVREVPIDTDWRLDVAALADLVRRDRAAGFAPFLIVATAGTTNAGVVDPVAEIAELARAEGLWLHLDAAWGGAAALMPELRDVLAGSERADSITFDAHKWLSVPMAAGLFLTRHAGILARTFRVSTPYMPREGADFAVHDPFTHSMQWSRRFIGLKVFLSLAVAGWEGYAEVIRHQTAMGDLLRRELADEGWEVVNHTPLPTVCFVDGTRPDGRSADYIDAVARRVVSSGRAWISATRIAGLFPVLRACVTNYLTGPDDVRALVSALREARSQI